MKNVFSFLASLSFTVKWSAIVTLFLVSACSKSPEQQLQKLDIEATPEAAVEQVQLGNIEAVELLLKAGVDVNYDDGEVGSLLFNAIHANRKDMIMFLLDHGADPNQKNGNTNTPLIKLVREFPNMEAFNYMVKKGADIHLTNESKRTPLMYAINANALDISLRLIALGADTINPDGFGVTPLKLAAPINSVLLFEHILSSGADVNSVNDHGNTVLLVASSNVMYEGVLDTLLKYGADIHAVDRNKTTVLMNVAMRGSLKDLNTLIKAGADLHAVDSVGRSALYYAIDSKNVDKLKALVEAGAKTDILDKYNTTILVKAAQGGNEEMVRYVLEELKVDPSIEDSQKYTALKYAQDFKFENIVKILSGS